MNDIKNLKKKQIIEVLNDIKKKWKTEKVWTVKNSMK